MTIGIRFRCRHRFTSSSARNFTYLIDSDCRVNTQCKCIILSLLLFYLVLVCIIYVSNKYSFSVLCYIQMVKTTVKTVKTCKIFNAVSWKMLVSEIEPLCSSEFCSLGYISVSTFMQIRCIVLKICMAIWIFADLAWNAYSRPKNFGF